MASYRPSLNNSKPWRARVRKNGNEYYLGYYTYKHEAVLEELLFKKEKLFEQLEVIEKEIKNLKKKHTK